MFAGGHDGMTDLQNMENNFQTLKSMFSGLTAPSSPVPFQPWGDSTKKLLKYRNPGDTAWIGVMAADVTKGIWFYVNSAIDGWTVNPYVYDSVLAVKGGSTYIAGGMSAGSFSLDAFEHNHEYIKDGGSYQKTFNSGGSEINTPTADLTIGDLIMMLGSAALYDFKEAYTGGVGAFGTWRPAAGVGTLQHIYSG